jgi:ketosteroid isomerase-like protein
MSGPVRRWDLTIFANRIDPNLEEDVQHVFIKTLNVRDGTLIVTSERGETYRIDLKTKAVTQSERPNTALEPTVRAEILALESQWATAIERQDAAAFERLAAEDFRFIEEDGQVLNRAQYIAARSHNPDNVESAVQDEIEIRQYGDAAIATGYSTIRGTRGSVPFVSRFRWTDVYVRRAGRWQAVSGQLTSLPQ